MKKAERDAIMRQGVVLPDTPRQRRCERVYVKPYPADRGPNRGEVSQRTYERV